MRDYQNQKHTTWDCKYPVVFIPKRRKKVIFGAIRKHLGKVLKELAVQKECEIVEGHLMSDHVHMCISIPPKHSVSYVVGYNQREECDIDRSDVYGEGKEFYGRELLGPRLLCIDSRT
jgi:putative transposase